MNWRLSRAICAALLGCCGIGMSQALWARGGSGHPEDSAAPPWHELPMVPLASHVRSLEARHFDAPVWDKPGGARRGSLLAGTRLVIVGSRRPSGDCRERWFWVGPSAWVCGAEVVFSGLPPSGQQPTTDRDGLPYRYYFAGLEGAFGYSALSLVGEGIPDSQLEPGFAIAALREKTLGNEKVAYTSNGLWVPVADLVPAKVTTFEGVQLDGQTRAEVGWSFGGSRYTFTQPFGTRSRKLDHRTAIVVRERKTVKGVEWLMTEQGDYLREQDVRLSVPAPPPADVSPHERWIDIDTRAQVLTAYVGTRPVFVTLVSTGKGTGSSENATPIGEHRIWVKLATSDMTNVEESGANSYYAIEAVPWVQFFKGGYGLHAAFWHDDFGTRRSHGCVNLSPKDAAFLFHWTDPWLPPGWHAVHPTPTEQGTRVRVR